MRPLQIAVPVRPEASIGNYIRALSHLGADARVVHSIDSADPFDGLLLPGGWDADPAFYGEPNTACQGVDRTLDDLQLRAMALFTRAEKPVLGICRGEQMINVFFGGSLVQHLPTAGDHSRDEGSPEDKVHMTTAEPDSFLDRLYGPRFAVNSSHHQGVNRPGDGLRIVQTSDDGVVEGIEHEALPVWGVQWHPERMCFEHARTDTVDGSAVIDMFLQECKRRL